MFKLIWVIRCLHGSGLLSGLPGLLLGSGVAPQYVVLAVIGNDVLNGEDVLPSQTMANCVYSLPRCSRFNSRAMDRNGRRTPFVHSRNGTRSRSAISQSTSPWSLVLTILYRRSASWHYSNCSYIVPSSTPSRTSRTTPSA